MYDEQCRAYVKMTDLHLVRFNSTDESRHHSATVSRSCCSLLLFSMLWMEEYMTQSSANSRSFVWMFVGRSFMNTKNRIVDKPAPWGTRDDTLVKEEYWLLAEVNCLRLERKCSTEETIFGAMPSELILLSNRLCGTRSKALEKSRNIASIWR